MIHAHFFLPRPTLPHPLLDYIPEDLEYCTTSTLWEEMGVTVSVTRNLEERETKMVWPYSKNRRTSTETCIALTPIWKKRETNCKWKTDVKSTMEDRKWENRLLWKMNMINPWRDKAKKMPLLKEYELTGFHNISQPYINKTSPVKAAQNA
jgi:hypothetical protein